MRPEAARPRVLLACETGLVPVEVFLQAVGQSKLAKKFPLSILRERLAV